MQLNTKRMMHLAFPHTNLHAGIIAYAASLCQKRQKHVGALCCRHVAHTRAGQLPQRSSTFLLFILQAPFYPLVLIHFHRFHRIQASTLSIRGMIVTCHGRGWI